MAMKFRFRWIPFVATMVAVAVGITLGQWQTRRAAEKEGIEARLATRASMAPVVLHGSSYSHDDIEYRQVVVRGEFLPEWTVYLDNRPYKGTAGFYVITPLKISGSDMHVLVVRGWTKRDIADRTRIPAIPTPAGTIEVQGIARRNPGQVLQLGRAPQLHPKAIVQNIDSTGFADAANLPMQAFVIEQINDMDDGLVRDWPRPSTGVEKHRGYAFQWYALAAMAFVFFVVTGWKRGK